MVNTPVSPNKPDAQETQPVTNQQVQAEVKILEDRVKRAEWWMIGFTAVIALSSLCMVIVGILQWNAMSDQLIEIRGGSNQTERLVILNTGQLTQANRQASAALLNVRAWVVVEATGFQYRTDDKGSPRVRGTITMTNTGPSPALNVQGITCGKVRADEPTVKEYGRVSKVCIEQSFGEAGKGTPFSFNQDDTVQIVPKNSLPNSTHDPGEHYYVWGRINYDISPIDKGHFTTFCLLSGQNKLQMGACRNGNDGN